MIPLLLVVGAALAAPDPSPDQPITLEIALDLAVANGVDAESARLDIEAARVALHSRKQAFVPDLGFSLSTTASVGRSFSEGLGQSVTTPGASSSARVVSTVPVLGGGRLHADVRSATADLQAAAATLERTRQDLRRTLAHGLLDLAEARGDATLAEASLAAELALRDRVQAWVDAGARTRADLLQGDAAVASAEKGVLLARTAAAQAELTLVQVLRLDPAKPWSFAPPEADVPVSVVTADRPDIEAAAAAAEAAAAEVRAAKAGAWPTADLSFGASTSWYSTDTAALPSQLTDQARAWATVDIGVPILDRSVTRDAVASAQIAERSATLSLAATRESAAADVARARLDQDAATAAVAAATRHRDAARAAAAVLEDRYAAGAAAASELLTARSDLAAAERDLLAATIAVQRAAFDLEWATGGAAGDD